MDHVTQDPDLPDDSAEYDESDIMRMRRPGTYEFMEDSPEFYRWYEYGGIPRPRPLDADELASFLVEERGYASIEDAMRSVYHYSKACQGDIECWNALLKDGKVKEVEPSPSPKP